MDLRRGGMMSEFELSFCEMPEWRCEERADPFRAFALHLASCSAWPPTPKWFATSSSSDISITARPAWLTCSCTRLTRLTSTRTDLFVSLPRFLYLDVALADLSLYEYDSSATPTPTPSPNPASSPSSRLPCRSFSPPPRARATSST